MSKDAQCSETGFLASEFFCEIFSFSLLVDFVFYLCSEFRTTKKCINFFMLGGSTPTARMLSKKLVTCFAHLFEPSGRQ